MMIYLLERRKVRGAQAWMAGSERLCPSGSCIRIKGPEHEGDERCPKSKARVVHDGFIEEPLNAAFVAGHGLAPSLGSLALFDKPCSSQHLDAVYVLVREPPCWTCEG
jgi:hypothetical protein